LAIASPLSYAIASIVLNVTMNTALEARLCFRANCTGSNCTGSNCTGSNCTGSNRTGSNRTV